MAQKKTTVSKNEINRLAREKKAKRNITFSFSDELLKDFSDSVERENLTMTEVVEQLIRSYLGSSKNR